jgi:catechol 2,3-dioxygenase-like lactoylglutathione lyase family enzyme
MADPAAATAFYTDKLSFERGVRPLEPGYTALALPELPAQQVEIMPASAGATPNALPFHLIFSVADLRSIEERLRSLGLTARQYAKTLMIEDPDGDEIVFVARSE